MARLMYKARNTLLDPMLLEIFETPTGFVVYDNITKHAFGQCKTEEGARRSVETDPSLHKVVKVFRD